MSFDFNANEIFEMAEQLERNGASFYRNTAQNTDDADIKSFLQNLAKMEDAHEKTFNQLKNELSSKEKEPQTFDPENEAVMYLKALADSRVFANKEIKPNASMKDVIHFAMEAEKDSIVFYLGMKDLVPKGSGKTRIDGIIKEEMGHLRLLANKLKSA